MTDTHTDQSVREAVLNPLESFIVQAPAGSGKTELLTQRFLTLLSTVETPEEIIAITFTRKAAQEMQHRIMHALKKASTQGEPSLHHEKTTYRLAKKALTHNDTLGWNLQETPNRLRILTLDALSAMIDQQSPIATEFGAKPEISDDPDVLYEAAITALLLDTSNEELTTVVNHFLVYCHNNIPLLTRLLKQLLATREQWLAHVMPYFRDPSAMKEHFESAREKDKTNLIHRLHDAFPASLINEIGTMLSLASQQLPTNECSYSDSNSQDISFWQAASELMLTKQHSWRKSFTKKQGFPAPSSAPKEFKETYKINKDRMNSLMGMCTGNDLYRDLLIDASVFPVTPYDAEHWKQLEALTQLLPYLVAQLNVCFQTTGKVDFNELTLAAIRALYANDEPTYLAMKLDYQIKHLLVDECQDTSNLQHELLTRLIDGWAPGDNRTLFLVGDPMQSIYRFRNANVSHFLRIQELGINRIKPQAMRLTRNFRSTPVVIDWVNDAFSNAFSTKNDPQSGAVAYAPSMAAKENTGDLLGAHHYPISTESPEQEAETIKHIIADIQHTSPDASIALLVRARHQLEPILPVLQAAGIAYHANQIDSLTSNPDILDLMNLTRAFHHLNDRTAWIGLLRSPWFALSLGDLLTLCEPDDTSIYTNLCSDTCTTQLSETGQERLRLLRPMLTHIMEHAGRSPLHHWVKHAWYSLGGPSSLVDSNDMRHINRFFDELANITALDDIDAFMERFSSLYAEDTCQTGNVHVMTIHKSKGLEFDHVIIPGLHRANRHGDHPMLRWASIHDHNHDEQLLLACRTQDPQDSMYDYLAHLNKQQLSHELTRLFYVACTRAKLSLHMTYQTDSVDDPEETMSKARSGSFLSLLKEPSWSLAQAHQIEYDKSMESDYDIPIDASAVRTPVLESYLQTITPAALPDENPVSNPIDRTAQLCGNALHAWLAYHVSSTGQANPKVWIDTYLKHNGMRESQRAHWTEHLVNTYQAMLADTRGQWILNPKHADSHVEHALNLSGKEQTHTLIIDRWFVDDGTLWIIDYKTSQAVPATQQEALERHEKQLSQYRYALSQLHDLPIRMGVYYTEQQAWFEL